jgi:hypothetical protein
MTKFKTGKPPRTRSDKPKLTIADLPPLEKMDICSMHEAVVYVRLSLPIIYGMLKTGQLESRILGGRRFVTADSIRRVIKGNAPIPKRAPKFVALRRVGRTSKAA